MFFEILFLSLQILRVLPFFFPSVFSAPRKRFYPPHEGDHLQMSGFFPALFPFNFFPFFLSVSYLWG